MATSAASAAVTLVSFSNQLAIAMVFGATWHTDAYQVGVSAPMTIMGLAAGLSTHALIPALVRARTEPRRYALFACRMLACFAVIAALVAAVGWLGSRWSVALIAPSLRGAAAEEAAAVARVSWLNAGCLVVVSCLGALHNASGRFLIPVLANLPVFVGMTLMAVVWGTSAGVVSVARGMLAGYFLTIPLLLRGLSRELRLGVGCGSPWQAIGWEKMGPVFARVPLVLISMLCFTMFSTVDAVWASRLGQAELSALAYGQRLLVSLGTAITVGPATVLLPYLSEAVTKDRDALCDYGGRVTRMVLVVAAPVAMILSLLRVPVVELLFERGAFTHATALRVAAVLPGMFAGMVPMLCAVMLFKGFYAKNDALSAAWVSVLGVLVYFISSGFLSHAWGVQGIVGAYVLTWSAVAAACLWRLSGRSLRAAAPARSACFTLRLAAALAIAALVTCAASSHIQPLAALGWLALALFTAAAAISGALAYAVAAHRVLGIEEIGTILEYVAGARAFHNR